MDPRIARSPELRSGPVMTALLARRRIELTVSLTSLGWRMSRLRQRNEQSSESILGDADVAVTLTSHGSRINDSFYTLESIGAGSVRPRSITLYLQSDEALQQLSEPMHRLMGRGLHVEVVDNFGPHTKYFPYVMSIPTHTTPLITVDDDMIYPRSWLRGLTAAGGRIPAGAKEVLCYRAKTIMLDDAGFEPYSQWPFTIGDHASFRHLATGMAGVLYPPALLDRIREAGDGFLGRCERADDVWLHAMALRNGYRVRQVNTMSKHPPAIPESKAIGLWRGNVNAGGNDLAIAQTYTDADLETLRAVSATD